MLWFLRKQLEKVASMTTLLDIARRSDTLFDLENVLAPEQSRLATHMKPPSP